VCVCLGTCQVGPQVLLFGGESDSGPLDDVWLLGGWGQGETLRWTQLRLRGSPQPRFGHAMAGGLARQGVRRGGWARWGGGGTVCQITAYAGGAEDRASRCHGRSCAYSRSRTLALHVHWQMGSAVGGSGHGMP
jgi:hypothetical protein